LHGARFGIILTDSRRIPPSSGSSPVNGTRRSWRPRRRSRASTALRHWRATRKRVSITRNLATSSMSRCSSRTRTWTR